MSYKSNIQDEVILPSEDKPDALESTTNTFISQLLDIITTPSDSNVKVRELQNLSLQYISSSLTSPIFALFAKLQSANLLSKDGKSFTDEERQKFDEIILDFAFYIRIFTSSYTLTVGMVQLFYILYFGEPMNEERARKFLDKLETAVENLMNAVKSKLPLTPKVYSENFFKNMPDIMKQSDTGSELEVISYIFIRRLINVIMSNIKPPNITIIVGLEQKSETIN